MGVAVFCVQLLCDNVRTWALSYDSGCHWQLCAFCLYAHCLIVARWLQWLQVSHLFSGQGEREMALSEMSPFAPICFIRKWNIFPRHPPSRFPFVSHGPELLPWTPLAFTEIEQWIQLSNSIAEAVKAESSSQAVVCKGETEVRLEERKQNVKEHKAAILKCGSVLGRMISQSCPSSTVSVHFLPRLGAGG